MEVGSIVGTELGVIEEGTYVGNFDGAFNGRLLGMTLGVVVVGKKEGSTEVVMVGDVVGSVEGA
jgi:hypothetical protein